MTEASLPEESIFGQALEFSSAEERAAFLDRACGDNQALRAEVEALLHAHERSGDLLDLPEKPQRSTDLAAHEVPGNILGPYKLLEQIGEGGMGTVWMAEQTEPFERRVAIKVIKEGMDSRQVLARFEAERHALALMEHPNIAKVLDAGRTPSGRPYFVMELVKGQPLTKYCDDKRLGVRQRLELFGDVCRAVQHAHQKGIIHRDLKPSNVLVAPYDGRPVVKVIDFGVAKATAQRLTDKTLFTGFGAVVGTPEYMSPEQAEVNNQDIDTRSDIYALGVLLYELLTGSTPLTHQRIKEAALLEVLRVIREEEPPRPSTRLSESKDSLPSISAQRQTEPATLTRLVRGELDWIVMKCLEKDRNRRYETANGLAGDIEHYLHDEPVNACPPSRGYRLRKFARKNRKTLMVGAAFAMLLFVGAGVSTWQAVRATRAQLLADEERQRAQGNLQVALKALDGIYLQVAEERLPRDPQRKKEDTELLRKALEFYQQFAQQNSGDAPARLEMGRAYRRVGDIQRFVGEHAAAQEAYLAAISRVGELPSEPESSYELAVCHNALAELLSKTGQWRLATEHFHQAIDLLTRLTADDPAVTQYQAELERSHHGLGKLLKDKGERRAAEETLRQALEIESKLSATFPRVPQYRAELAEIHRSIGYWMEFGVPYSTTDEIGHIHRARDLLTRLVADFPDVPLYRQKLGATLQQLGSSAGDDAASTEYFNQAISHFTKLVSDFPQVPDYREELGVCYGNLGVLNWEDDDWDSAAKYYCKAHDIHSKLAADYPTVTRYRDNAAASQWNLADVSIYRGEFNQACEGLKATLGIEQDLLKAYPDNLRNASTIVGCSYDLSLVLVVLGQPSEALKLRKDADRLFAESWKRVLKDRGPSTAALFCADVARDLESSFKIWQRKNPSQGIDNTAYEMAIKALAQAIALDPKLGEPRYRLAFVYREQALKLKRPEDALERHRQSLAVFEKLAADFPDQPQYPWQVGHSLRYVGFLLAGSGRTAEATSVFKRAISVFSKLAANYPGDTDYERYFVDTYRCLGNSLITAKQYAEAESAYRQALESFEKFSEPVAASDKADFQQRIGQLQRDAGRFQEADVAFRRAVDTREKIAVDSPETARCRFDLALVLRERALLLCNHLKKTEEAEELHRREVSILEKLAGACPNEPNYRLELGHALWHWSDSLNAAKRTADAEKTLRESLLVFERLATDFPKEPFYQQEAAYTSWARLAPLLGQQSGRLVDAEEVYRKGLAAHEKLVAAFPLRDPEYRRRLASNYDVLANLLRTNGRTQDAEQVYRQAVAFYSKLASDKANEPVFRDALVDAYRKLALFVSANGRFDEAVGAYRKFLELAPKSAVGHNNFAWLLATCPDARFRDPRQALDLAKKAVELAPKEANNWNTLGVAQYRVGDWKAAITALEKSMELRKGSDSFDWFFLAMARWQLGDKKEARKCYDQAVEWQEKNQPKNEELGRFRAEAETLLKIERKPMPK